MEFSKKFTIIAALILSHLIKNSAVADGLSDVKNALDRLQGTSHIAVKLVSNVKVVRGEGKKKKIKNGQVTFFLEEDNNGLQVLYDNGVLKQIKLETQQKTENEDTDTTTLNAVNRIIVTEMQPLLSASSALLRAINKATFLIETLDNYKDKEVRLLQFKLPVELFLSNKETQLKLFISDKEMRSYIKKFEANYSLWIAADGTPLKSSVSFNGKGRAYIFFSVTVSGDEQYQYQVVDERLVVSRYESEIKSNTTFGVFQEHEIKVIKVQ